MQVDVAIVGAGAGGLAVASSLKKQQPKLSVAVFDPADVHYYQPGVDARWQRCDGSREDCPADGLSDPKTPVMGAGSGH